MKQKAVPPGYRNVGRFWGCSRRVIPKPLDILTCTEDDIRGVIQNWEYAPKETQDLYTVLYGVAELFKAKDSTNGS